MSVYFNRTNGPLALTLRDGSAILIVPKGRAELTPQQDGSTSILRALKKGFIADVTPPADPKKESAPPLKKVVKVAPTPAPNPEPKAEEKKADEKKGSPEDGVTFGPGERKRDRR